MSTIRLTGGGSRGNNDRGSTLGGGFKDNKGISLANRPSCLVEKFIATWKFFRSSKISKNFQSTMIYLQSS